MGKIPRRWLDEDDDALNKENVPKAAGPSMYFNLPLDKAIQGKIEALINLVLSPLYVVRKKVANGFDTDFYISRPDKEEPCAVINYFWSNGPMLRFRALKTVDGNLFIDSMKIAFDLDDSKIMFI